MADISTCHERRASGDKLNESCVMISLGHDGYNVISCAGCCTDDRDPGIVCYVFIASVCGAKKRG